MRSERPRGGCAKIEGIAVLVPTERFADSKTERLPARRYAWSVFTILFALMVVGYIDRYIVVSMFPYLKRQWSLSDAELGALASIVSVLVAIGTVPISLAADRWGRVRSLFVMALAWSGATVACAYAASYGTLLAARGMVGLGAAAYGSVGGALLASVFPVRNRAAVLGAFLAAAPLGSVIGVVAGGAIAQRWGWPIGFAAAGLPGLVLALLLALRIRDCGAVGLPDTARRAGNPLATAAVDVARLLRPRSALLCCIGGGLQLVTVSTIYAWMPSYLNRYYALAPADAGLRSGLLILFGAAGGAAFSVLADAAEARFRGARIHVAAAASTLTALALCAGFAGFEPGSEQIAMLVVGIAAMTGTLGPVSAVVVDVSHASLRATALAVLALIQNLLGLAAGPLLAGALSDRWGLSVAISIVPAISAFAAVAFVVARRSYDVDLRNAA